jgi:hypothetical protein
MLAAPFAYRQSAGWTLRMGFSVPTGLGQEAHRRDY